MLHATYGFSQCNPCVDNNELVINGGFEAGIQNLSLINGNLGSDHNFITSKNPTDPGDYTITTDASIYNGWLALPHGGQYFLVADDSPNPLDDIWRQTNVAVVPGNTYYFSAWVNNLVLDGDGLEPPTVSLLINNVAVASMTVNEEPDPGDVWYQVCGEWVAPANVTSAQLHIRTQSGHRSGVDLGIDDISFRKTGQPPVPVITMNSDFCVGESVSGSGANSTGIITWHHWTITPGDGVTPDWSKRCELGWLPGSPGSFDASMLTNCYGGGFQFEANKCYLVRLALQGPCSGWEAAFKWICIRPKPNATLTFGKKLCAGECMNLTATGGTQYQWSTGQNGTTSTIQVCPSATTIYKVTVTNSYGCTATKQTKVTILPKLNVPKAEYCYNNSAYVCLQPNFGLAPYSYTWSNGNSVSCISGVVGATFKVTVTDAQGLNQSGCLTLCEGLGASPQNKQGEEEGMRENREVAIFPNPTHGRFSVALPVSEETTISVFDIKGGLVRTVTATGLLTELDLTGQPEGLYHVRIQSPSQVVVKKIMVE